MTKVKGTGNGANVSQSDSPAKDSFWLKDVDDLDLRKLLEELYCDKKYMDRIIKTMGLYPIKSSEYTISMQELRS